MDSAENFEYIGSELEVFALAQNWKNYFSRSLIPHIHGRVLEVGAGIGETTKILCHPRVESWVCLEPDSMQVEQLKKLKADKLIPNVCEIKKGTTESIDIESFDSILYIDVLEHIEDDLLELKRVIRGLKKGGRLTVLAPAYQFLFSEFDQAIGHYRRYTKRSLKSMINDSLVCQKFYYLDSVGLLASLGNRLVLKKNMPSRKDVSLWDSVMIPMSRVLDPLVGHSFGRSIVGIWTKSCVRQS
jgi:SAM-dependent methyltransferase